MAFKGITLKRAPLELSASKVTAAVSTVVISVAGVFFGIQRGHSAQIDALQQECDAALERAYDAEARTNFSADTYIARLEYEGEVLQTSNIELGEHGTRLQAVNQDLRARLRQRSATSRDRQPAGLSALGTSYQGAITSGERVAGHFSTDARAPGELEVSHDAALRELDDRARAFEAARLSVEREFRALTEELAYEQWLKTVRQAVEGECRSTWGGRRFNRCAEQVELTLRPLEGSALECITRGHGLPFYTVNPPARSSGQDFLELKRGVVVPCDPTLRDRKPG